MKLFSGKSKRQLYKIELRFEGIDVPLVFYSYEIPDFPPLGSVLTSWVYTPITA